MFLASGGIDVVYIDESGDDELFVVTSVTIPLLRPAEHGLWRFVWEDYLNLYRAFRTDLRNTHGIPVRKELHASKLVSGRGARHHPLSCKHFGRRHRRPLCCWTLMVSGGQGDRRGTAASDVVARVLRRRPRGDGHRNRASCGRAVAELCAPRKRAHDLQCAPPSGALLFHKVVLGAMRLTVRRFTAGPGQRLRALAVWSEGDEVVSGSNGPPPIDQRGLWHRQGRRGEDQRVR